MIKKDLENTIEERIKNRRDILSILGAFGDMANCEGYIESEVRPQGGGLESQLYGITYRFKGYPRNEVFEGIGLAKAMVSVFPRMILSHSFALRVFLLIMLIFRKNKLIHYFHVYSTMIYGHVTLKVGFDPNLYNRPVKELKRAFDNTLRLWDEKILSRNRAVLASTGVSTDYDIERDGKGMIEHRKLIKSVSQMLEFGWLFVEHDNAYRFPLQDVLPLLSKDKLRKSTKKELLRIMDILIDRAHPVHGIRPKAVQMRKLLWLVFLSRSATNFIKEFLLELDTDKLKLDEDDWYFCLKRRGFNFR